MASDAPGVAEVVAAAVGGLVRVRGGASLPVAALGTRAAEALVAWVVVVAGVSCMRPAVRGAVAALPVPGCDSSTSASARRLLLLAAVVAGCTVAPVPLSPSSSLHSQSAAGMGAGAAGVRLVVGGEGRLLGLTPLPLLPPAVAVVGDACAGLRGAFSSARDEPRGRAGRPCETGATLPLAGGARLRASRTVSTSTSSPSSSSSNTPVVVAGGGGAITCEVPRAA